MNRKFFDYILLACAVLSAVLLFAAVASPRYAGDTASAARKVERRLSARMARLERFVGEAPRKLPDDMVIYTYVNDSLLVWQNQFPVRNDDISSRVMVQRLTNPRAGLESPLANASGTASFMNLGANWYIVKAFDEGAVRKIAGLMVVSGTDRSSYNGVNPRLGLGMRFSVKPLTFSEGSPVRLDSVPVFKILYDSLNAVVMADGTLLWLALALFLVTVVLFVLNGRSPVRALAACGGILAAVLTMYFWGRSVQSEVLAFSPMLYSGGRVFFSLGAVLLLNLAIFLCVLVLYLVRRNIWSRVRSNALAIALAVAGAAAVAALCFYLHFTIRSIILNSGISLELYKFSTLSVYSFLVYASLLTTLSCIPMILQLMQPVFSRLFGWHADMFSPAARLVFSLLAAVWLVVVSAVLGFEKEEDRMEVWAGKLAVDRDVNLELALMRVERRIAEDGVIAALSTLDGSEGMIRNRIIDNYLGPVAGNYGINVVIIRGDGRSQANTAQLRRILREGVPIATGSPFLCIDTPSGTSRYDGVFTYYDEIQGAIHVIVGITRRNYSGAKGYSRLATVFLPSRGNLPQAYSYSRYHGRNLRQFNGEYPYSTIMGDDMYRAVYEQKLCHFNDGGYVHFVTVVTEGESVIISRRRMGIMSYAIGVSFVAVLMGLLLLALRGVGRRKGASRSNYFLSRVERALTVSLTLTLVAMAGASVFFVYRRNEANQQAIMSARINAVQMLVQDRVKRIMSDDLLHSSELAAMLTSVSDNTGSDITLYTTSGKMAFTTDPEVFDRMILGYRINPEALDLLLVQNRRYCILREDLLNRHFHNMYVPFTGPDGTVLGILCSPFIEENYDFERDAAMHLMAVFTVFLLMFLLSRFSVWAVMDRVFKPLSVLGMNMRRAGVGPLEHIEYGRDDEITALVDAYNRMVDELSESSLRLAQAERDKAWSGMARQVAHEIKNPLTPMKLQIQRLIRLKDKGDPSWTEKFDDVSKVLLDHIDILTETSNEFSTFARLYTEEYTEIDLDALLQEELSMFDNRDDVRFSYLGLKGALVSGPRPQLTRVFVNLLGNAVQAVEGVDGATVNVSLRKGTKDGFYDIVIEDNGPGVSEDNVPKLFTPNFTTKNGGSGLGLAISHSILDRCGATISYSRSFSLGGACFTVSYPYFLRQ